MAICFQHSVPWALAFFLVTESMALDTLLHSFVTLAPELVKFLIFLLPTLGNEVHPRDSLPL
jgi:hypothetical protein